MGASGSTQQERASNAASPVRRRFEECSRCTWVIWSGRSIDGEDEALSTGKTVFDRLGGGPHAGAVFDYHVLTFDEEDTSVAGKAR